MMALHAHRCVEEGGTMNVFAADAEPYIKSQLIDLSGVPITVLRRLDDATFHRSLRHVVQRTAFHWLTETSCSELTELQQQHCSQDMR
jgi:hypothetical protein